jgi:hypothetical protein
MNMTTLEPVASAPEQFTPANPSHLFAFRIAQRLDDLSQLDRYLVLFEHFPTDWLLKIYTAVSNRRGNGEDFFATFRKLTD